MTPERWAKIKEVVAEAIETPIAERAAFVERACSSDKELRQEVESLLAASNDADSLPQVRNAIASAAKSIAADNDSALRTFLENALGQQYDILRPLGRGGMGAVYLARERSLERFVAIKVLSPDLAAAPESRERFRREARIAAQLSHPSILPLYTFGEVGGLWYFVMGYVRGESLAERLRLEGRMPWADAHHVLTELADALECAHKHGVVHRDIKPANILLDDETGHTILADFGISKMSGIGDSLTATGVVIGTPDYMSPEQALGSADVDERSDIYSLGAVAYKMLSGREPFAGVNTAALMLRRLADDPTPLQSIAPSVPDALASVVMKCLARDRDVRWRDARELKDALARAGASARETLPEAVRDLPSFGAYALLWAVAWTTFAILPARPTSERALLFLIAFLIPLGLMLHVWNVGRHGLGAMEIVRIASWPPEWWGMWWPRALRRPNDLWRRLPWPARFVRIVVSGFFFAIPALIVLRQWLAETGRLGPGDLGLGWIIAAESVAVLATALAVAGALGWARRRGLTTAEALRVLLGATTASSSWTSPRIARLLAPATGRVRPPDRDSPADHRRAIADLLPILPASASELGSVANIVTDRVLRAIEERDREVAVLARDASVGEVDRLTAQLAALGEASAGENQDHRELRELVRHQLDLVHRMRGRLELASQQRARLFDLLRGVWTQLKVVCDAPISGPGTPIAAADRVRVICVEIAGVLDAPVDELSRQLPFRADRVPR